MAKNLGKMKTNILLLTFFSFFTFYACQEVIETGEGQVLSTLPAKVESVYTGIDIEDKTRSCIDQSDELFCTEVFTEEDQFALDCQREGQFAVMCGCHDWICVTPDNFENPTESTSLVAGLNIDGAVESCEPLKEDVACTTEFTEEDQFAIDCQIDGLEVVQCGCHKYLCQE